MNRKIASLIIISLLISSVAYSQDKKKVPAGLGFEAGMGYNMLTLEGKGLSGADTTVHCNSFWMQPSIRLHYDVKVKDFGLKNNSIKLKTFLGYYTFGGKVKVSEAGEYNILSFASIEAGAGPTFDFMDMFQLTPMFKAQYVVSANERYIRETSRPALNIRELTNLFSYNAGLQFRFKYKHFTVGLEGWYGLADIHKDKDKSAKENNFRLLVGYEF